MTNGRTIYLPNGTPAPELMTAPELAVFLRLDTTGIARPDLCIKRLRESGKLKGVQISRQIVYPLGSALAFIERELAEDGR